VDGGIHRVQRERDAVRDQIMHELGATILRLPNECISNDIEDAKRRIRACLPLPPRGRGAASSLRESSAR
jgi:very-short-patch-repair endonuclease